VTKAYSLFLRTNHLTCLFSVPSTNHLTFNCLRCLVDRAHRILIRGLFGQISNINGRNLGGKNASNQQAPAAGRVSKDQ